MSLGQFLQSFFEQIWRIFLMDTGLFGLKFADILLGGFIVSLGISIIKFFFVPDIIGGKEASLRTKLLNHSNKKYEKKGDKK